MKSCGECVYWRKSSYRKGLNIGICDKLMTVNDFELSIKGEEIHEVGIYTYPDYYCKYHRKVVGVFTKRFTAWLLRFMRGRIAKTRQHGKKTKT